MDSDRGIGVATGSIETAERTGNTRSIEPGLRVTLVSLGLVVVVGDTGTSDFPVNMLTGD